MSKELFVSSTPHETKVAIVEEDQLAEIYFERENEYTLAGSIYKGRVTRVLPGMQSAFVDIGLERDAFLYVTDFFEQDEEDGDIEALPGQGESNGNRQAQQSAAAAHDLAENGGASQEGREFAEAQPAEEISEPDGNEVEDEAAEVGSSQPQTAVPAPGQEGEQDRVRRFGRRRRGRRGRGFPDSKFDREPAKDFQARPVAAENPPAPRRAAPAPYQPIILPGESISKYRNLPAQAESGLEQEHSAAEVPFHRETAETTGQSGQDAVSEAHAMPSGREEHRLPEPNFDVAEPPKRPTEEIDVASILEKHAAEKDARAPHQAQGAPGRSFATGVIEEEEIEEEEAEHPQALHAMDDEDYEDLEEETLEANGGDQPADTGWKQAQQSSDGAGVSEGQESASHEIADYSHPEGDFEEEELSQDGEEQQAGPQAEPSELPEEGARAEVRGPSGYQQKVGFDRNRNRDRGRRGGRRMRNAPRGRKFHRGPLPQIADLLKEGQEVLVQIAKEPIGKKGARITSHIALPGRFLVYMPTVNHNGVSRKIASEEERQRLKRIILSERQSTNEPNHHGGFIVRTAAAAASEEDLRADIRFLLNLWSEIKGRADSSNGPTLIYHDLNLVERVLRDQVSEGFSHLWIDSEQEYERVLRFISRFQPSMLKRVKLYTKETPLFEEFNIQEEINKALKSKVWLKSGGYIVINQTEALVAIDVNTGKYVGKTQKLEDTIVKTNVDAIKEIVRQIRLRDLGGIIVIDFIDMDERRNRQKVMQALEEALKSDRAPSKVLQFNDFGLVAITRKRVKQSLERTLGSPCTYCTGTGLIKSVATVCNEIYVEMRKLSKHLERGDVIARVNPEVGKALKANNARWLQDMEDLTGKTVIVKPDPTLHQEQFDIH